MSKKVKVLPGQGEPPHIVEGNIYEVEKEDNTIYYLVGRPHSRDGWYKVRFEVVEEDDTDPTPVVETPTDPPATTTTATTSDPTPPPFDFEAYNGLKR